MDAFAFPFIFGLVAIVIVVLPGVITIWLIGRGAGVLVAWIWRGKPTQEKRKRTATRATYGLSIAMLGFLVYTAVYPTNDFYFREFESVTFRKLPMGATVVAKHATYPDLHGDYCSFSRIRLTEESFSRLKGDLMADERLHSMDLDFRSEGRIPETRLPSLQAVKLFRRKELESDHQYSVIFMDDGQHLEVNVCVT